MPPFGTRRARRSTDPSATCSRVWPTWLVQHVDAPHGVVPPVGQTSDGRVGLRTAYFDATRMGTFRGEVTDFEPPARIGFRETLRWFGSDLMEARPVYILEADRDKTIVHHVAEGELFGTCG